MIHDPHGFPNFPESRSPTTSFYGRREASKKVHDDGRDLVQTFQCDTDDDRDDALLDLGGMNNDDPCYDLHEALESSQMEVTDTRLLLQLAAENGKLLADKYFQMEVERDDMAQQVDDLRRTIAKYEASLPVLRGEKQALVQKCIDVEQQLNSAARLKDAHEMRQRHQEIELARHREATAALRMDNASLREQVQSMLLEQRSLQTARAHMAAAVQALQAERDQLRLRASEMEQEVLQCRRTERSWSRVSAQQQERIHELEASVDALQAALLAAVDEAAEGRVDNGAMVATDDAAVVVVAPLDGSARRRRVSVVLMRPVTFHLGVAVLWLLCSPAWYRLTMSLKARLVRWLRRHGVLQLWDAVRHTVVSGFLSRPKGGDEPYNL
ncbi:Aste57867_17595 [Aphanomyces stellatus]|uniref:Aste57867_17595 protein n=1 Tax=Aphanomyces stellatus TaxID=120398 RepID=A0A485L9D8_9STRA|nr:hypothetical protein As57867_017535 [Aphanomyces stellatus]VFT94346.1 Aste57867_17595 [Aphanomyces stellatus]